MKAAERKRLARRAADRRQAANLLRITECTCRYAASQLANGASPEEATQVLLFAAGELVAVAEALRRAVRLSGPERRALAVQMARFGTPTKVIADRLGVSGRSVRNYVLAGNRLAAGVTTARRGARRGAGPAARGGPSSAPRARRLPRRR